MFESIQSEGYTDFHFTHNRVEWISVFEIEIATNTNKKTQLIKKTPNNYEKTYSFYFGIVYPGVLRQL